jgi:hypothetical protein
MVPTNGPGLGRKRWILTGALLLLTLIGATIMAGRLPRTYKSESSVVLLASKAASKPNGYNPYLSFSFSLTLTADILTRELMAPDTVKSLASRGYSSAYLVALATYTTQTTGSVLLVTATGTSKVAVERTLLGVTTQIGRSLASLQAANRPRDRIRAMTLSQDSQPAISVSSTARPMAIAIGLGIALSVGIPWVADASIARRQIRRQTRPDATLPLAADPAADERSAIPAHGGGRLLAHSRRPGSA